MQSVIFESRNWIVVGAPCADRPVRVVNRHTGQLRRYDFPYAGNFLSALARAIEAGHADQFIETEI